MAWNFDEVNDEVQITDDAVLTLPDGDWSVGGWIKLTDNTGTQSQYFMSWGAFSAAPSFNWLVYEASHATFANRLELLTEDSGAAAMDVVPASTDVGTSTAWQHLIAVRTGVATITVYRNGASFGSAFNSGYDAVDVSGNLYLGTRSSSPTDRWFGGDMAEWAKWDRALSADEITALAAGYVPDFFPTPVWHCRMFGGVYQERMVPLTVSNTGSTAADHPPLIYPSRPQIITPPAAAPGGNAPTGVLYGSLVGPLGGAI